MSGLEPDTRADFSFNSLQTGKAFRTGFRGGNSHTGDRTFQFPSNGKGFPNLGCLAVAACDEKVSIPFKRERLSERKKLSLVVLKKFVSIPFKRERLSELFYVGLWRIAHLSVSIPFKRERLSELFVGVCKGSL